MLVCWQVTLVYTGNWELICQPWDFIFIGKRFGSWGNSCRKFDKITWYGFADNSRTQPTYFLPELVRNWEKIWISFRAIFRSYVFVGRFHYIVLCKWSPICFSIKGDNPFKMHQWVEFKHCVRIKGIPNLEKACVGWLICGFCQLLKCRTWG